MTDREKLIELIDEALESGCRHNSCSYCSYLGVKRCSVSVIADFLIANGVTVQQWIPVSERLPETDDFVLVIATGRAGNVRLVNAVELATYDPTDSHNPWLLGTHPAATDFDVSYWMPLPKPPKED